MNITNQLILLKVLSNLLGCTLETNSLWLNSWTKYRVWHLKSTKTITVNGKRVVLLPFIDLFIFYTAN
jgi:hypothetical protein